MANSITTLITWFTGSKIGQDQLGNRYFQDRKNKELHGRVRRWVIYKGNEQAANIPPMYHAWLHHTSDTFPNLEQQINTHYPQAYKPKSSLAMQAGKRQKASGDYEAWQP